MTAYGFKARFVGAIERREKVQTVRKHRRGRSRHARPGEDVQLYRGMRTPACAKIVPDVRCASVRDVAMLFNPDDPELSLVAVDGRELRGAELEAFARADGFAGLADMAAWFAAEHGAEPFHGVVITWTEKTCQPNLPL